MVGFRVPGSCYPLEKSLGSWYFARNPLMVEVSCFISFFASLNSTLPTNKNTEIILVMKNRFETFQEEEEALGRCGKCCKIVKIDLVWFGLGDILAYHRNKLWKQAFDHFSKREIFYADFRNSLPKTESFISENRPFHLTPKSRKPRHSSSFSINLQTLLPGLRCAFEVVIFFWRVLIKTTWKWKNMVVWSIVMWCMFFLLEVASKAEEN